MNFEETFPLRFWINLGRRGDRRGEMEWRLHQAGVTAERFPAVDARFVKRMALERRKREIDSADDELDGKEAGALSPLTSQVRGYESAGRYALALTQRMVIRQAKLRGAEAVLLLEDDVILHPNFRCLVEGLELPEDWGIFYLGCLHQARPDPAAPGIVRAHWGIDTHAVAVRAPYYDRVLKALDAHLKPRPRHPLASDQFLAALQSEIPSYACFPNLAWQADEESDLLGKKYTQYHVGGTQKTSRDVSDRTFASMFGSGQNGASEAPSKLGLLFLTRGDVNQPEIWREFVAEAPDRVQIFSHPKLPDFQAGGFLEGTAIAERHETAWGSVSLVKATLSLLRAALEDESLTHFVLLSESCVPIRPLSEMLRHLRVNPNSRFGWKELSKCSDMQRSRAAHLPQIPEACWRFQSQWWLLDRTAAEWVARVDYTEVFGDMPIPDEAYFATVLSLLGYPVDDRVENKDITWTNWEKGQGSPTSYSTVDATSVRKMVESPAWFARKFSPDSDIGTWGLHRVGIGDNKELTRHAGL